MPLRVLLLLSAFAVLSACAGSAPVAVEAPPPPPPPVAVQSVPRPPPPPPPAVAVVPEPPPAPPPSAPRGTLESRTFYERSEVSEWILATGATVVFRPMVTGSALMLVARSTAARAERHVDGRAGTGDLVRLVQRLAAVLGPDVAPESTTYVLVGAASAAEIEAAAARALVNPGAPAPPLGNSYRISMEPDPALAMLLDVLVSRDPSADVFAVHSGGVTTLWGAPEAATLAILRPTQAEVTALARSAASPALWTRSLADLYRAGQALRPSADPATIARAITPPPAATTAEQVAALAARFAASPVSN